MKNYNAPELEKIDYNEEDVLTQSEIKKESEGIDGFDFSNP